MGFLKSTVYKCSNCGKEYSIPPQKCECDYPYKAGNIVNWALLLADKTDVTVKVQCLICGEEKEVAYYNISRQKSCGCVPKGIDILAINKSEVRYRCKKCGDVTIEATPIKEIKCECRVFNRLIR